MSENKDPQLSPSELQALRADLKEEDHRRWLISWLKTLATWTGAVLSVMWAGIDGVMKLIAWIKST